MPHGIMGYLETIRPQIPAFRAGANKTSRPPGQQHLGSSSSAFFAKIFPWRLCARKALFAHFSSVFFVFRMGGIWYSKSFRSCQSFCLSKNILRPESTLSPAAPRRGDRANGMNKPTKTISTNRLNLLKIFFCPQLNDIFQNQFSPYGTDILRWLIRRTVHS